MDLGKLFFTFCGYFSERIEFTDSQGERNQMLRYDYLGGNVTLPVDSDTFANAPPEGTLVRVSGIIKVDKNKGRITLKPLEILVQGRDKEFTNPTQQELMSGCVFEGNTIVSKKDARLHESKLLRSATIAIFGGAHKFTQLDEQTFEAFPEKGLVYLAGKVDAKVTSYEENGRYWKRCENTLDLYQIKLPQSETKASKAPAA